MATVSIVLGYQAGGNRQIMRSDVRASETRTSSASNVQSTIVAQENEIWEIACASALWVTFGANPTAAAGTTFYVPGGVPRNFQARAGDKCAVIDA